MPRFTGFPQSAFEFYDALALDNTRAWWTTHKGDYDTLVREPMAELLAELEGEFGTAHVFRPYRDVRFAKDKTPYKDHQGGFVGAEDGIGWYVQISASGLMIAGGWYSPVSVQVQRYRDSIDSPVVTELDKALAAARKGGLTVGGDVMKTRPRGVAEDHPHLELMRHRSLTVENQFGTPAWMSTRTAFTKIRNGWRAMTPLVEWLADHVGPAVVVFHPEPR